MNFFFFCYIFWNTRDTDHHRSPRRWLERTKGCSSNEEADDLNVSSIVRDLTKENRSTDIYAVGLKGVFLPGVP